MKVCTDACLFGAWTVKLISKYQPDVNSIVDIGTGTGLLSLMLAQKINASFDAIEIDSLAAEQAASNVKASPWHNIRVHNVNIEDFKAETQFDFIISNPPFYQNSLRSPVADRNAAMHDRYLTLEILIKSIDHLMSRTGYAAVLLPFSREFEFNNILLSSNLYVVELTWVRQSIKHDFFRSMFLVSREGIQEPVVSEIAIHDNNRVYTNEFKELLKDYYLDF